MSVGRLCRQEQVWRTSSLFTLMGHIGVSVGGLCRQTSLGESAWHGREKVIKGSSWLETCSRSDQASHMHTHLDHKTFIQHPRIQIVVVQIRNPDHRSGVGSSVWKSGLGIRIRIQITNHDDGNLDNKSRWREFRYRFHIMQMPNMTTQTSGHDFSQSHNLDIDFIIQDS